MAGGWYEQDGYAARFDWGVTGLRRLGPRVDVVVVVDVLSFSTAVEAALTAGGFVYPYRWRDASAAEFALARGARLARGRSRVRESGGTGGALSLSPPSLRHGLEPGDRVVLPSPNGAACVLEAAELGRPVVAACLRNAGAVARYVRTLAARALVCAAGERWPDGTLRPAYEDLLGAGAVLAGLDGRSPEADAAVAGYQAAAGALPDLLLRCASGRELAESGWADDVGYAAELDVSEVVPVLVDGAFRPAATEQSVP